MKDMTEGRPAALLFRFFVPVFLGNLFQQLYSMVDTVLVGRFLGVNALAGVGSTGSFNYLFLGFVIGCASGFGIVVSQDFGARDFVQMRKGIANAFYLSVAVTIVMTLFTTVFCGQILDLMQTPEDIWQEAYDYIFVVFAGIAATFAYNIAAGILRAIGDSMTPLLALVGSSILNVILDLVFILVFHMGTMGAGLATVLSQAISGIICFWYLFHKYEILRIRKEEWKADRKKMRSLLGQGIPMALQFSITAIGAIILQVAVNGLGAVCVAAMTAGFKIMGMFIMIFDSFGLALSTYCSQNTGARKYGRVLDGISTCYKMMLAFCACSIAVILAGGRYMALLFVRPGEDELKNYIITFITINGLSLPFSATLGTFRYALQGMGYSFVAMFAGASEMVGRIVTAAVLVTLWGFTGVCFGNPAAWSLADLFLIISYFRITRKTPCYREALEQKRLEKKQAGKNT